MTPGRAMMVNSYCTHIGNELFAWFSSTESKSRINFLSCLGQGIPVTLSIVSDDAGQFNVFDHALCWIHAERIINRLIPLNAEHVKAVDDTREQLRQIYRDLKTYKLEPTVIQAEDIKSRFKAMCSTKTAYVTLNLALQRMGNNQHELLRVLDKPYLPLQQPERSRYSGHHQKTKNKR